MAIAAIVRRIRSLSLSIGQLTFAGFMLLLAMTVMISVASVVAIRHIDATFGELQRLQDLGAIHVGFLFANSSDPHQFC